MLKVLKRKIKQDRRLKILMGLMLPRWWHERTQPLSLHKDQWLDSFLLIKTTLGELWSLFKKLQQHSETKKKQRLTVEKEKENNFIFPALSHPPSWHCSVPKGIHQARKSSPWWERKYGVSNQLSQLLGRIVQLSHFHFIPLRPSNLRHTETDRIKRKKSKGYQGLPRATHSKSDYNSQRPAWQTNPTAFSTEGTNDQYRCCRPPADFTSFRSDVRCLSLSSSTPPSEPMNPAPAASPGLCGGMRAKCQSRLLELTPPCCAPAWD